MGSVVIDGTDYGDHFRFVAIKIWVCARKRRYSTEKAAQKAASRANRSLHRFKRTRKAMRLHDHRYYRDKGAYQCPFCTCWHVGRKPDEKAPGS